MDLTEISIIESQYQEIIDLLSRISHSLSIIINYLEGIIGILGFICGLIISFNLIKVWWSNV